MLLVDFRQSAWALAGAFSRRAHYSSTRPFTVLGIETSCDDTGVAVVRSDGQLLGEALHSQTKALNKQYVMLIGPGA